MDARFQLRVQRYGWDRAAAHYEGYWAEQLKPAQDLLMEMANLQPGERVLDVACGTGLVTFRAAGVVGPTGAAVATDLSAKMVEHVAAEARERGFTNVTVKRAHAEERVAEPASFDAVLCGLGLMYVPDPLAALQEARHALRSGGRVVAAVWGSRANCGWAEIFPIVDRRVDSEVCPMFFQLGTGESLQLHLEQTGFTEIEVQRITTTLEYASADDALGAAFVGGPVAMAYSRFDDATRAAAHAEYLESIAPFRRDDGYTIPGEFVVGRATAP